MPCRVPCPSVHPRAPAGGSGGGADAARGVGGAFSHFTKAGWAGQVSGNQGQKPVREKALARIQRFAAWCFESPVAPKGGQGTIIAAGHSLWFKSFFLVPLPPLL